MTRTEAGQSLVEVALALPFLLLIVIGIADLGRFTYYTSAVTNGAREGALFASRNTNASTSEVAQRACDELGFAPYGSACPAEVHIDCQRAGIECDSARGQTGDVYVHIRYDFKLISGMLVGSVFSTSTLGINSWATFPGIAK